MPANTVRVPSPVSRVSLSSLSAPSTFSARTMRATRRSILLKSSMVIWSVTVCSFAACSCFSACRCGAVACGTDCLGPPLVVFECQLAVHAEQIARDFRGGHREDGGEVNRQHEEGVERFAANPVQLVFP